ncbi:MAG: putative addiction module antidote protein family [Phycisphaerales bacterium]|nr:putative addiction module antidote protein family [Phycisphaerales bacterium]
MRTRKMGINIIIDLPSAVRHTCEKVRPAACNYDRMTAMSLQLKPELQKFIDDQVKAGRYDSPEEVVEAGIATLVQQERYGDFAPGELDRLLAEGEADIQRGDIHDGDEVFRNSTT